MKSIRMASLAVRRSRGTYFPTLLEHFSSDLKVVTNEKGEAVGEVVTIIC